MEVLPSQTEHSALHTASRWQQAGANQHHTGFNPNEVTITAANVAGLVPMWESTTGLRPGAPVVGSGRVYAGSENKTLYAFHAKTGRRRWRAFADSGIQGSPAAAYGKVFFLSSHDQTPVDAQRPAVLYVLDSSNGDLLWTASIGGSGSGTPVVANRTIYISSSAGFVVFSVDGCGDMSCMPLWKGDLPENGVSRVMPVVGKDYVFAVGRDPDREENSALFAFPVAGCGEELCRPVWHYPTGDLRLGDPAYARGRIYLPTGNGLQAIFEVDGSQRWIARQTASAVVTAVANYVVYVGTNHEGLFALDERTGSTIWRGLPGYAVGSISLAGDVVFVAARSRSKRGLYAFAVGCATDGESCAPLWSFEEGSGEQTPIVVADGVLYLSSTRHRTIRAFALPDAIR